MKNMRYLECIRFFSFSFSLESISIPNPDSDVLYLSDEKCAGLSQVHQEQGKPDSNLEFKSWPSLLFMDRGLNGHLLEWQIWHRFLSKRGFPTVISKDFLVHAMSQSRP
jgi:hypothetical protein